MCVVSDDVYELIIEDACGRKFVGNRFWEWIDSRGRERGWKLTERTSCYNLEKKRIKIY